MTQSFSLRILFSFLLIVGINSMPTISLAQTQSCAADLNGDGQVNILDAIEYQNLHGTGNTTIEALTAFINAYPLGCDSTGAVILSSCAPDQSGTLLCPDSDGPLYKTEPCEGSDEYENFGTGGDIAGKCMVISMENDGGKVLMFIEENGVWKQVDTSFAYSDASSSGAVQTSFGSRKAIKLTDNYLFIGAPTVGAGSVYVYKKNVDGTWPTVPTNTLVASDGDAADYFGQSIDANGDYLIIGAPGDDGNGSMNYTNSGASYLYKLIGSTWTFEKKWKSPVAVPSNSYNGAFMGYSVALDVEADGDVYAYAGAPQDMFNSQGAQVLCSGGCDGSFINTEDDNDSFVPYGAVHAIKRGTGSAGWPNDSTTVTIKSSQNEAKSWFGYDVDVKNGRLAVSSKRGKVGSIIRAGYVEVFTKSGEWNNNVSNTMFAASSPKNGELAGGTIEIVGNDTYGYYLAVGIISAKNENNLPVGRVDLYHDADGSGNWVFHQNLQIPNDATNTWFGGMMLRMDEERDGEECGIKCVSSAIKEGNGSAYTFRLNSEGFFVLE